MSDIQSIANGTYVIGETSATKFVAGNGIKIDSPTEGTVRIANDETVLWSGSIGTNSTATLSEPYTNFERIRIAGYGQGAACNEAYASDISAAGIHELSLSWNTMNTLNETDGTYNIIEFMPCIFSGTTVTTKNGRFLGYWGAKWQYQTNTHFTLTRVIGINRISGSNA